jgi:hypothetical protein
MPKNLAARPRLDDMVLAGTYLRIAGPGAGYLLDNLGPSWGGQVGEIRHKHKSSLTPIFGKPFGISRTVDLLDSLSKDAHYETDCLALISALRNKQSREHGKFFFTQMEPL